MNAIADTDVLSAFGKADAIKYLIRLFDTVFVSPAAFVELSVVSRMGYAFAEEVLSLLCPVTLTRGEIQQVAAFGHQYPALGFGEIESIVVAKLQHWVVLTNDKKAKRACEQIGVTFLDLEELLRAIKLRNILSSAELRELIERIEQRDRTIIKAKDEILAPSDE